MFLTLQNFMLLKKKSELNKQVTRTEMKEGRFTNFPAFHTSAVIKQKTL